ncbi:MAG: hypothetical protein EBV53_03420 [Proteobacteria bacterium]|nr:hypothetical protein [Pseudomonadota bacterium]
MVRVVPRFDRGEDGLDYAGTWGSGAPVDALDLKGCEGVLRDGVVKPNDWPSNGAGDAGLSLKCL